MNAEEAVMKKLGLDYRMLDSGCCGMAGSFGFLKKNYEISMQCAERALLPAVRQAQQEQGALIVADGYSRREQIRQATGVAALHLAQVIRMAMCES